MTKYCRQCGKALPEVWSTDICLECSKENVRNIFKEHPDVKQAFVESVQEMKKPENLEKIVKSTLRVISAAQQQVIKRGENND